MIVSMGTLPIAVRPARTVDLPALQRLERDGFDDPWSENSLRDELAHPESVVLVAEGGEDGEPLAYAGWRTAAGEAELLRLAVAPRWRRRGVAAVLLTAGDRALHAAGCDRCYLEVRDDNDAAIALYERLGFHRIGRRRGYYGASRDALLYARAVRPAGV